VGTVDQAEERVVRFKGYQSAFMKESNRVVCVFGGKGSGKTFVGAHFALSQIEQGRKGLILLNSYSQVRDIFVQSLEPLLKEFGYVYDGPGVAMNLVFNNGALVHLRSSDAEVIKRIESIEYDWGWADEASYYKHESLRTFVSRIRKGPRLIRITSMPDEPDAFIYRMADGLCEAGRGQIFEVGLDANPDESFVDSYRLAVTAIPRRSAGVDRRNGRVPDSRRGGGSPTIRPEQAADPVMGLQRRVLCSQRMARDRPGRNGSPNCGVREVLAIKRTDGVRQRA
jgi:hypothetical protein